MKLKEITLTKLDPRKEFNFILPIGATEQHGPYIPFGTDTYIVDKIVEYVEREIPDLIVLPTLEYSRSDEHGDFYGTVWLKAETVQQIMKEITESLDKKTRNLFIISFHANDTLIKTFVKEHQERFKAQLVYLSVSNNKIDSEIEDLIDGPIDDHAGNTEISNILAIDRTLVTKPQLDSPKKKINNPFETGNLGDKSDTGIADNHPNWVVDEALGERILRLYSNHVSKQIKKRLSKR
jgi:creatinine amidohydrolase